MSRYSWALLLSMFTWSFVCSALTFPYNERQESTIESQHVGNCQEKEDSMVVEGEIDSNKSPSSHTIDSMSKIPNMLPCFELIQDVKTVEYSDLGSSRSPFIQALKNANIFGSGTVFPPDRIKIEFSSLGEWNIKPITSWIRDGYFQYDGQTIIQRFNSEKGSDQNPSRVKIEFENGLIVGLEVDMGYGSQTYYDLIYVDGKLRSYNMKGEGEDGNIYKTNYRLGGEIVDKKGNWIDRTWTISGRVYYGKDDQIGEPLVDAQCGERRTIEYYNPIETDVSKKVTKWR